MTPKIIELKQAPVVLVELEENIFNCRITSIIGMWIMDYLIYDTDHGKNNIVRLPEGVDQKVVGILSDLTEEQFAECVEINKQGLFKRYTSKYNVSGQEFRELDSKNSFYTLLESENVYTENPHGQRPNCGCYTEYDREGCADECYKWINAQSRTIDPKRTVVLIRKEDK